MSSTPVYVTAAAQRITQFESRICQLDIDASGMLTTAATVTPVTRDGAAATLITSYPARGLWSSRAAASAMSAAAATKHSRRREEARSQPEAQQHGQLFTYWFIHTPTGGSRSAATAAADGERSTGTAAISDAAGKLFTDTCQQLVSWCSSVSQRLACRRRVDRAAVSSPRFSVRSRYTRQSSTATTSTTASDTPGNDQLAR